MYLSVPRLANVLFFFFKSQKWFCYCCWCPLTAVSNSNTQFSCASGVSGCLQHGLYHGAQTTKLGLSVPHPNWKLYSFVNTYLSLNPPFWKTGLIIRGSELSQHIYIALRHKLASPVNSSFFFVDILNQVRASSGICIIA